MREITYDDDEEITVDFLKTKASQLFFPEGVSKYGSLSEMKLSLGNFAQETVLAFKDTMGRECTFQEYLKSHGLFASRCYIYLMSTLTEDGESLPPAKEDPTLTATSTYALEEEKNVFKISSKTELAGQFQSLQMTNTPSGNLPLFGVALKQEAETICTAETVNDHRLLISYETITESSYSDVIMRTVSFSRQQCYEITSFSTPEVQDIDINEFDPLDCGFTIVDISKGEECFVTKQYESSEHCDDDQLGQEFKYHFPLAAPQAEAEKKKRLIIHPPSQVWGYDGNKLIMGVVATCHMAAGAFYVWYRNGSPFKEGHTCCCIPVNDAGVYYVEVQYGTERDVSEGVFIRTLDRVVSEPDTKNLKQESIPCTSNSNQPKDVSHLPIVDKEEISYSLKDEIGRGSFGVVYKGHWAGTEVAIKQVKMRNAKRIQSVLETEVKVHSMVRHPNIVQIMAVSYLKNSILIVSELIEGINLEELIFGDGQDKAALTIQNCDKMNVGKQLCRAVAYLHNMRPVIVHRDIKPANVLVAKKTQITKLCDMGLSRLKSQQSLSQTCITTVPGTPSYMAPECLVDKKKATIESDVWSLGCTLLELFTEKDCWEDLLAQKAPEAGEENDDMGAANQMISIMRSEEAPSALQWIPSAMVGDSLENSLKDCFQYKSEKRPKAIDLVHAFPTQI